MSLKFEVPCVLSHRTFSVPSKTLTFYPPLAVYHSQNEIAVIFFFFDNIIILSEFEMIRRTEKNTKLLFEPYTN